MDRIHADGEELRVNRGRKNAKRGAQDANEPEGESARDHLTDLELIFTMLGE
jgi:hypothetical protein